MGVKPRQILELISLGRGEPVRKAVIAEQIWSGRPPRRGRSRWRATSRSCGGRYSPACPGGPPSCAPRRAATASTSTASSIDLHDFDRLVRRAAHAAPEEALPLWERAAEIADGALLATEPYAAWAVDARRTHERGLHAAAAAGAEAALTLGAAERAVPLARRATELDPLAEHGWQLLIRAELAAGRRAEAAHAFHTCRASLRRDLGLEPDVRTRELLAGVLAG